MRWRKGLVIAALCIAVLAFVGFGLVLVGGQGRGEVSAILFGAFLMLTLGIGMIALFVAVWARFWHLRWVRVGGIILILLGGISVFAGPKVQMAYHRYHADLKRTDEDQLRAVRNAAFVDLGLAIGDPDAALATAPALTQAIDNASFRKLSVSGEHDFFHAVYAIFMTTFHDVDVAPSGRWKAPFSGAICERFAEQFAQNVETPAQKARALVVCPSHQF